ncbi:MAG: hypothetical protein RSC06_06340 [Clostridia bacterium]
MRKICPHAALGFDVPQKGGADSLESLTLTRIVIAHRLSTIKARDRIIVLDAGRGTEGGSYDQPSKRTAILRTGGAPAVRRHAVCGQNHVVGRIDTKVQMV